MNQTMQPTTIFINVDQHAQTRQVRVLRKPYDQEDFRSFLHSSLDNDSQGLMLTEQRAFTYEFPDEEALPPLAPLADHSAYFFVLREIANKRGVKPRSVVSLRDAYYCREYGIDLFSEQGQHGTLLNAPGYKSIGTHFGILGKEGDGSATCRAVDIGDGVLLYDLSIMPGRDAYLSLLQHCADHYFDPALEMERLSFYDLYPFSLDDKVLIQHIGSLNFNFNHHNKNFSITQLRMQALLGNEVLAEALPVKEYDMSPTSACFFRYVMGEKVLLYAQSRNCDIAILDHMTRYGYPHPQPTAQWSFLSSYTNRFKDLAEQIVLCEDPSRGTRLQEHVRERAQGLLERDFPDRRTDPREPVQELSPYIEIPSQHFNNRPKI